MLGDNKSVWLGLNINFGHSNLYFTVYSDFASELEGYI